MCRVTQDRRVSQDSMDNGEIRVKRDLLAPLAPLEIVDPRLLMAVKVPVELREMLDLL